MLLLRRFNFQTHLAVISSRRLRLRLMPMLIKAVASIGFDQFCKAFLKILCKKLDKPVAAEASANRVCTNAASLILPSSQIFNPHHIAPAAAGSLLPRTQRKHIVPSFLLQVSSQFFFCFCGFADGFCLLITTRTEPSACAVLRRAFVDMHGEVTVIQTFSQ